LSEADLEFKPRDENLIIIIIIIIILIIIIAMKFLGDCNSSDGGAL